MTENSYSYTVHEVTPTGLKALGTIKEDGFLAPMPVLGPKGEVLLVGTSTVAVLRDGEFKLHVMKASGEEERPHIADAAVDSSGHLWLARGREVVRFDGSTFHIEAGKAATNRVFSSDHMRSTHLAIDKQGQVIALGGGGLLIRRSDGSWETTRQADWHLNGKVVVGGIADQSVLALAPDGSFWSLGIGEIFVKANGRSFKVLEQVPPTSLRQAHSLSVTAHRLTVVGLPGADGPGPEDALVVNTVDLATGTVTPFTSKHNGKLRRQAGEKPVRGSFVSGPSASGKSRAVDSWAQVGLCRPCAASRSQ